MSLDAEYTLEAVEKAKSIFSDGFQFSDIMEAVDLAISLAERAKSLSGEEKKSWVVEVIKEAYKAVDPDIPWVPEPIESWVEDYVLDNLVPSAIDKLVERANKGWG